MNEVLVTTVFVKITIYQCRNAAEEKLREKRQIWNGTRGVCTYTLANYVIARVFDI